jgi:hypothetical protein
MMGVGWSKNNLPEEVVSSSKMMVPVSEIVLHGVSGNQVGSFMVSLTPVKSNTLEFGFCSAIVPALALALASPALALFRRPSRNHDDASEER